MESRLRVGSSPLWMGTKKRYPNQLIDHMSWTTLQQPSKCSWSSLWEAAQWYQRCQHHNSQNSWAGGFIQPKGLCKCPSIKNLVMETRQHGPDGITRVIIKGAGTVRVTEAVMMKTGQREDPILLALKMEERAVSQGMQALVKVGESKEWFSLRTSQRSVALSTLWFPDLCPPEL